MNVWFLILYIEGHSDVLPTVEQFKPNTHGQTHTVKDTTSKKCITDYLRNISHKKAFTIKPFNLTLSNLNNIVDMP